MKEGRHFSSVNKTSSPLAYKNIWDLKSNNSTALASEMESTLKYLREYLKKLQYQQKLKKLKEKGIIDNSGDGDNFDNSFKDNLQLGHFLMTQTRRLLFLEKESKINKLNKPGQVTSHQSGNSITKSLYTIPSIKQSSIYSSYVDELQDILYQFNKTLVVKKERPMSLSKSKKSKNPKKKTSETEMVMTIFLREHAAKTNQFLKFNIIPTNNSFEFAYACSLLHLSEKGKARGKNLAKEAAARNLVQLLVDLQQSEVLPESISPFTKEELNMITIHLCEFKNYAMKLRKLCKEKNMKPPTFSILQSKPLYTTQCSALGQIALGTNGNRILATRISAKKIIEQFTKSSGVSIT